MLSGPTTMIALLVAGCLMILGVIVAAGGRSPGDPGGEPRKCTCGHPNRANARFCAQCGAPLSGRNSQ
jgi:hypothetical protein